MKIIIEKHSEGCVAYPAGVQGVVVGQGSTFEEALRDVQSAIRLRIETFGREALESESPFGLRGPPMRTRQHEREEHN